jgi:hypothetical protein
VVVVVVAQGVQARAAKRDLVALAVVAADFRRSRFSPQI